MAVHHYPIVRYHAIPQERTEPTRTRAVPCSSHGRSASHYLFDYRTVRLKGEAAKVQ